MPYMVKEELISWKDYACGANGQIYSYYRKEYLNGTINPFGYVQVTLKCVDGKRRTFYWHRVIWTFFYGTIPEGMEINHISEVKTENQLKNLSLVTPKENSNWGSRNERRIKKQMNNPNRSNPIIAYNDDGEIIHIFASMHEAERNGFTRFYISKSCKTGELYKGLHWEKI